PGALAALGAHVDRALEPAGGGGLVGNQGAPPRAGEVPIDAFLEFLGAFRDETHRGVVEAVVDALAAVDFYLVEPADRPAYAAFVEGLLGAQYAELGIAAAADDSDERRLRRQGVGRG